MKVAVMVETPRTGAGMDFVRVCRLNNIKPIILIKNPKGVPDWVMDTYKNENIEIRKINTYEFETLKNECVNISNKYQLVAIISFYEYSTEITAKVSESIGLKSPSSEAISIFKDKYKFRNFLNKHQIGTVPYTLLDLSKSNLITSNQIEYPCVIKPINLTGSAFVRKCETEKQLIECFNEIKEIKSYTEQNVGNYALVEKYVIGQEYSVEVLNGEIITIVKKYIKEPGFIESGHDMPAQLNENDKKLILNEVEKVLNYSGYQFGFLHIELKLNEQGVHFIEINPRIAGGRIPELIRQVYKRDVVNEYLLSIIENENKNKNVKNNLELLSQTDSIASIRFMIANKNGILKDYTNLNNLKENVYEYKFYKTINDPFEINFSNKDRVCHVIAISDSIKKNEEIVKKAFLKLNIKGVSVYEYRNS